MTTSMTIVFFLYSAARSAETMVVLDRITVMSEIGTKYFLVESVNFFISFPYIFVYHTIYILAVHVPYIQCHRNRIFSLFWFYFQKGICLHTNTNT